MGDADKTMNDNQNAASRLESGLTRPRGSQSPFTGAHRAAARGRLAVAREMTSSLDTLTEAGQRFMMGKVVAFLEGEFDRSFVAARPPRRTVVASWLGQLAGEATRVVPDSRSFTRRAESLIDAFAVAA